MADSLECSKITEAQRQQPGLENSSFPLFGLDVIPLFSSPFQNLGCYKNRLKRKVGESPIFGTTWTSRALQRLLERMALSGCHTPLDPTGLFF
jgi:hypothetical protein